MQSSNQDINCCKEIEMNAKQIHEEIRETNLSYMGLVQKMIRADKVGATAHLGMSEEMADLVAGLSPAQLIKMSGTNMLLCCFRFEESPLLDKVADHAAGRVRAANRQAIALAA
jgi:flagellar transcriptional activator FlhD